MLLICSLTKIPVEHRVLTRMIPFLGGSPFGTNTGFHKWVGARHPPSAAHSTLLCFSTHSHDPLLYIETHGGSGTSPGKRGWGAQSQENPDLSVSPVFFRLHHLLVSSQFPNGFHYTLNLPLNLFLSLHLLVSVHPSIYRLICSLIYPLSIHSFTCAFICLFTYLSCR